MEFKTKLEEIKYMHNKANELYQEVYPTDSTTEKISAILYELFEEEHTDWLIEQAEKFERYEKVLDGIKDAWISGQPDHNGEVECEVEDTCDAMYQLAVEAIDYKLNK